MGLYFSSSSLFVVTILFIIYVAKKKLKNDETKIYGLLLFFTIVMLFLEVLTGYLYKTSFDINSDIYVLLSKFVIISYVVMNSLFSKYIITICYENRKNTYFLLILFMLTIALILCTPLNFVEFENSIIPKGVGIYIAYGYCIGFMVYQLYLCIKFKSKISLLKFTPYYLLLFLGVINVIITYFLPATFLIGFIFFLSVLVMYFTIENPDLKLLNEYTQNKELLESNIESKINMLFKVSEDVKSPLKNIKKNAINILNVNKKIEKDDYAKKIYNESNNVLNDINEVFNVSSIDNSKVKIVDTTFNIYNLYDEIIYIIKNKVNENTNFKYSITDTIPRLLYGDNVRIKQIIVALLLNSISDKKGIIHLDIYEIVKNDICRLVIIVQSSYIKLDLNEINNILSSNVEISNDLEKYDISLKDIKKLIDVIGGTLLINDNDGIINFKIIINEKIKTKKDTDNLDLIANKLTNKKRVLLASDDYLELSAFTNILKNNNFTVDTVMYYKDITSKLNGKNKYDLLIIDDEMNDESAVSIIKEINKLKLNHLKKIVLLDNDKELIKKHYLENNIFDDYIFKSNFKEDLKKVTTKYK